MTTPATPTLQGPEFQLVELFHFSTQTHIPTPIPAEETQQV